MRRFLIAAVLGWSALLSAGTNDLGLARQALRDGLWKVAREHARAVEGDEGKYIILESFAREGHWDEVLKALDAWGNPVEDGFLYYRAAGQYELGKRAAAQMTLEGREFKDVEYRKLAARLRARLAKEAGQEEKALKILREDGGDDFETQMMLGEMLAKAGDAAGARGAWAAVVAATNAAQEMRVVAAANLGDAAVLRELGSNGAAKVTRQMATLQLGVLLLKEAATRGEGEGIVRGLAKEAPDVVGVKEAFRELARQILDSGDYAGAAKAYADLLEMWPVAAKEAEVQEGRGWALLKLGKAEEALEAFRLAEELAGDDELRAAAGVKVGDALAALGKDVEAMAKYRAVVEALPKTRAADLVGRLIRVRELEETGRRQYAEFRFADAMKTFEEVAKEDVGRKARMDYFEVLCLYGQGRDVEAEEAARQICEKGTDEGIRAEATLWLAKAAYNGKKWKEARERFVAYREMCPTAGDAAEALVWAARAAFAEGEAAQAIQIVTKMVSDYPEAAVRAQGWLVQGEALVELARFDESVLVLDRVLAVQNVARETRMKAQILRSDALFAMGADNPARYQEALETYRAVRRGEDLSPSMKLVISFKVARTLEKLRRLDEATDQYYTQVILAYREGRAKGVRFDDEARAVFSRAAFRLAEEFESRGETFQAVQILDLVVKSDVPAAAEAARRIERIRKKGNIL